jgi:hypothetical protein
MSWRVLYRIISEDRHGPVQSPEITRLIKSWDNGADEETTMVIRAIYSSVVARAQRCDDLWFAMAFDEIGVPESVLRNHATHGNNLSLAVSIHVVRKQFTLFGEPHWPYHAFWKVLEAASKFDVLDTSPELQREFCALWNQVVRASYLETPWYILRPIRDVYVRLHLNTDSAPTVFSASIRDEDFILSDRSSYPLCRISNHHPHSTTHVHDVSASAAIAHVILHDDAALDPSSLCKGSSRVEPETSFFLSRSMLPRCPNPHAFPYLF